MGNTDPYRVIARFYDRVLEPVNAPLRSVAARMTQPQPEWVVLDVGCGTGAALADYQAMGCHVIGVDTSNAMITLARERLGGDARLHNDPSEQLPVDDDSVDLVHFGLMLHSVSPDTGFRLLREAGRVIHGRGRVVVIDFAAGAVDFPRGWGNRAASVVAEVAAGPTHARHSLAYHRRGGLAPLAGRAGLSIERSKIVGGGNMMVSVLIADR